MTAQSELNISQKAAMQAQGELTRRLSWAPLRVLAIVTGLFFIRGLLSLAVRYCLAFRRRAKLAVRDSSLILEVEWSILGKRFRQVTTQTPIGDINAIQLENRQRYLYLLVGFGALAIGTWIGIQWFVDGLRAGYPYLALVGAGVVIGGILIDLVLYLFVPDGPTRCRLVLAMGPWKVRISGVEPRSADLLFNEVRKGWEARVRPRK
ncbi:MAG: hypothetical protein GY847_16130 [Proteobacteria bacterium]|nr:hypothetical protein [Pseudomonadota bacterium]